MSLGGSSIAPVAKDGLGRLLSFVQGDDAAMLLGVFEPGATGSAQLLAFEKLSFSQNNSSS